jgi:hypothetical protein
MKSLTPHPFISQTSPIPPQKPSAFICVHLWLIQKIKSSKLSLNCLKIKQCMVNSPKLFKQNEDQKEFKLQILWIHPFLLVTLLFTPLPAVAESLEIEVNSNEDMIQADEVITLREAIEIVNGSLPINTLSEIERIQINSIENQINQLPKITFNLPEDQTTIQLKTELPTLKVPVILDGTTQPNYETPTSSKIGMPVVNITPLPNTKIPRGLTITSDGVTIRGLSLFGFTETYQYREVPVAKVLPADIFIDVKIPPTEIINNPDPPRQTPFELLSRTEEFAVKIAPRDIVIENNWLGTPAPQNLEDGCFANNPNCPQSAFGIYVFSTQGTVIQNNLIANHAGSGILTGQFVRNLRIDQNQILKNGNLGMPHAIHLEGNIENIQITRNEIQQNAGSAVYVFKPLGSVQVVDNQILENGQKQQTPAIYLMGNRHLVMDNQISRQNGPGVVIAAYPKSDHNVISGNQFSQINGLSLDLITQSNAAAFTNIIGDGPNPPRNSPKRRQETGNAAVNAPELLAPEFFKIGEVVNIDGIADAGSLVEIYRVESASNRYGPLSELLAIVETDTEGRFGVSLENLQAGDAISAIAIHPQYGTSEPALSSVIREISSEK